MIKLLALLGLVIVLPLGAAAQNAGWKDSWEETLAAARQEGKVVVSGPPVPELRQALPVAFKARYGIAVEYIAAWACQKSLQPAHGRRDGSTNRARVLILGSSQRYPRSMRLLAWCEPMFRLWRNLDELDAAVQNMLAHRSLQYPLVLHRVRGVYCSMRPIAKPQLVPKGLKLENVMANRHQVSIYSSSTALSASCPGAAATPAGYTAATSAPAPAAKASLE